MATDLRFGIIGEGDAVLQAYQDIGAAEGAQATVAMAASAGVRRDLEAVLSVRIVEAVEEVCADPDVQAVYISLPAGPREQAARQALEAGKHVLLAGPWDVPLAEAETLCALASSRGAAVGISAPWAVSGAHVAARALVRAGWLGEIISWRDDLLRPQPIADTLRQALRPLGLFGWLTNLQAEQVYALEAPPSDGLDLLVMLVRYTNGCVGSLQVGRGVPGGPGMHPQGLRIVGRVGQLDLTDEPMIYRTRSSEDAPAHTWQQVRHSGPRGDRPQAIAQFAASAQAGKEPPLAGRDVLESLRIIEAAQRSLTEGAPVPVKR